MDTPHRPGFYDSGRGFSDGRLPRERRKSPFASFFPVKWRILLDKLIDARHYRYYTVFCNHIAHSSLVAGWVAKHIKSVKQFIESPKQAVAGMTGCRADDSHIQSDKHNGWRLNASVSLINILAISRPIPARIGGRPSLSDVLHRLSCPITPQHRRCACCPIDKNKCLAITWEPLGSLSPSESTV